MNLILQHPTLSSFDLAPLVALARAQAVRPLSGSATRLEGVAQDAATRSAVADWCRGQGLDHAFMQARSLFAQYRILALDMDSTLITIECIDEIADAIGVKPQVAAITEAAMRGEITDFSDSLRRRVALLAGTPASALQEVYDQRLRLNPGAERLLQTARAHGLRTLLVSGGFTFFTDRLRERLPLDETHANTLEIVDGVLTGRVLGPILDAQAKARHLREFAHAHGADAATQAIAVGDGANDLAMMAQAGLSVAYHAKPAVQAAATVALNHVGLDGILQWFDETAGLGEAAVQ